MPAHIQEVTVHSLGELIEAVTPRHPERGSGRLRESAVYRGVSGVEYGLMTSLDRLGTPRQLPHSKAHLEAHLLRNFIRYSRPHLPVMPRNIWEVLVIAQHHGLPTRLLDWSHSPLIAAHFATTGGKPGADRAIWKLDYGRMHERFRLPRLTLMVEDVDRVLAEKGIHSIWDLFDGERKPGEQFICMLEPIALDRRIVAQSAAFTLASDRNKPIDVLLDEAGIGDCLTRFVIPATAADRIRDQLDLCGISERRIFADLDGVADELRRYYDVCGEALRHAA